MITVDTHVAVKKLVASGFTENEAEDMISSFVIQEQFKQLEENVVKPSEFKEAIKDLRHDIADLSNKLDSRITEVKNELKSDIAELRSELKGDIAKLDSKINETKGKLRVDIAKSKNDLLQWMVVLILGVMGMIIGLYFK